MSCVHFVPVDAFQQSCGNKHSQNLDRQHHNCNSSNQALVLLDPAGDPPDAASQKNCALSGELV